MIFSITEATANNIPVPQLSEFCMAIVQNGHYMDCNASTRNLITDSVKKNASTVQKELYSKCRSFDVTNELREFLKTIHCDKYTVNQLSLLASKPARILMENTREWPVYESIIGAFKRDRVYGNIFQLVENAKCFQRLLPVKSGGVGDIRQTLMDQDNVEYKSIAALKHCLVFDRDTDAESTYSKNQNSLLFFLCGKDSTTVTDSDVYKLDQGTYIWHIWYRRDIESYFPKSEFQRLDYELKPGAVESYYLRAEDKYHKIGTGRKYDKNDTPRLAEQMSRQMYEDGLKTFMIKGKSTNELQLLLLKFAKVI